MGEIGLPSENMDDDMVVGSRVGVAGGRSGMEGMSRRCCCCCCLSWLVFASAAAVDVFIVR